MHFLITTFLDKREVENWNVFWQLSGQKLNFFVRKVGVSVPNFYFSGSS